MGPDDYDASQPRARYAFFFFFFFRDSLRAWRSLLSCFAYCSRRMGVPCNLIPEAVEIALFSRADRKNIEPGGICKNCSFLSSHAEHTTEASSWSIPLCCLTGFGELCSVLTRARTFFISRPPALPTSGKQSRTVPRANRRFSRMAMRATQSSWRPSAGRQRGPRGAKVDSSRSFVPVR